jgi:hypothetical protein
MQQIKRVRTLTDKNIYMNICRCHESKNDVLFTYDEIKEFKEYSDKEMMFLFIMNVKS